MNQAKQILMSKLRSQTIDRSEFACTADQIGSLLALESLNHIPTTPHVIATPIGTHTGVTQQSRIVLVIILRSGLAFLKPFSATYPHACIGFLGLERTAQTKTITTYYKKLPPISENDFIIILDPMLATGTTANHAIATVISQGAQQKNMLFVSLLACKAGIEAVRAYYPEVKHITAAIDEHLTEDSMISPGLGDFGDRYFQT